MTKKQLDQALKSIEDYIAARVEATMLNATMREVDATGATATAARAAGRREVRAHQRMVKTLSATLGIQV